MADSSGSAADPNSVSAGQSPNWWRGAAIYQVYIRSFQDSNADGVGDLKGIAERLDYIAKLGVDALWVTPFYPSPMKDSGYDVSDYIAVDPAYGHLEDVDDLVKKAHEYGLKIMIDLVLSHTSDQHRWFEESRRSCDNPFADWYVWADAKEDGGPPNNWLSVFGGPAWEWDSRRCQYYFHNFLISQPDLNFHSIEVQDALLDTARFWLDRGIDGFRLDTANFYFCDPELGDNPPLAADKRRITIAPLVNPYNFQSHVNDKNRPENIGFFNRLRSLVDSYPDRTLMGEIGDAERGIELLGEYTDGNSRLHSGYAFDLLSQEAPTAARVGATLSRFRTAAPSGWPTWAFSNHDVERHASRWALDAGGCKTFATLLACLRGSICIFQGEELGMTEAELPFEKLRDPYGIRFWPRFVGRDGCRTPMVWSSAANCGFSVAEPWLPIAAEHRSLCVEAQEAADDSVLTHYRKILKMRRQFKALREGELIEQRTDGDLLSFQRVEDEQAVLCVFNLGQERTEFVPPAGNWKSMEVSAPTCEAHGDKIMLDGMAAYIAVNTENNRG